MPRPLSWLPRLHQIRRAVAASVRSHWGRRDLEELFALQPRAAQKLLSVLPTVAVGTSRLVEREVLSAFLDRIHEAEDPSAAFEAQRHEKTHASRRRLRSLIQRSTLPVSLAEPPAGLALRRGHLSVDFRSLEELAAAMYYLAQALEADGDGFAAAYEPLQPIDPNSGHEAAALFGELERLETARRC